MAYFAIGLPIAILIRLFAGVPLFWFIVIPITILTFIGIAKMDDESVLPSRKFKDGKSIDSLAMAKKYYEEYRRRRNVIISISVNSKNIFGERWRGNILRLLFILKMVLKNSVVM